MPIKFNALIAITKYQKQIFLWCAVTALMSIVFHFTKKVNICIHSSINACESMTHPTTRINVIYYYSRNFPYCVCAVWSSL